MDSDQIVLERLSEMKKGILGISRLDLVSLPKSPLWKEVKLLICDNNQLTTLPALPNVRILICDNNQLTTLPSLPSVIVLYCNRNHLTTLPPLPEVEDLDCRYNQLITLPVLPKVIDLNCSNNPLLYPVSMNEIIHSCRKSLFQLKIRSIIGHWRHYVLTSIINKKRDLHNELLYSPSNKFYLQHRLSDRW